MHQAGFPQCVTLTAEIRKPLTKSQLMSSSMKVEMYFGRALRKST